MTFYTKLVSLAVVSFVALTGCGDPSDGNAESVEQSAGSAGVAGSGGSSGSSGSSVATGGSGGSAPSGSAGMFGGDGGSGGKAGCESIIDCSDMGGECAFDDNGDAYCVNPCDKVNCPTDQTCHIVNKLAKCEGGAAGSAGTGGSSGSSAAGAAGSSAGAGAGSSGSAGSSAGSAGSSAGSAGSSGSICSTAQAGAWCPVEQAGIVCGSLVCNGVWTPTGSAGSAGSAGASGSSGNAGTAGSASTAGAAGSNAGPVAGELGEFSLTIALKESGAHSLKLFAFESNGSVVWGTDPNFTATDTKFAWKVGAHWGAYVQLNGSIDNGVSQLCYNNVATEPMWATYKGQDGIVRALKAPIAVSEGGGCHLRFMLESCGSDADPDCDGKTGAQGDCDQSIGKGQATYPGALESGNDTDDLNCDGNLNPSATEIGQVYVRMTGMPHGVTARFYDDLNWVDGGLGMNEVSNGVYDTVLLSAKPKTFYVTWTPAVNGKNSSAGKQGGICISNVSTVSVFNAGTNTVATSTAPSLTADCHWSAIYN